MHLFVAFFFSSKVGELGCMIMMFVWGYELWGYGLPFFSHHSCLIRAYPFPFCLLHIFFLTLLYLEFSCSIMLNNSVFRVIIPKNPTCRSKGTAKLLMLKILFDIIVESFYISISSWSVSIALSRHKYTYLVYSQPLHYISPSRKKKKRAKRPKMHIKTPENN